MTNKKEQIQIDKEFLDCVVKSNSDLKEAVEMMKKEIEELKTKKDTMVSVPPQDPKSQSVFFSAEILMGNPKSITEVADLQSSITQFRADLKSLMEKFKIGQVSASLLAKL